MSMNRWSEEHIKAITYHRVVWQPVLTGRCNTVIVSQSLTHTPRGKTYSLNLITLPTFLSHEIPWFFSDFLRAFPDFFLVFTEDILVKKYVSLQLCVQNRRRKWHFPPNFWNGIIWTAPFPLNIRNGIIWGGAFSKAFRSSEALISVLSKNARLYDNI